MSRSYRRPFYVEGYGTAHKRFEKNQANRCIRRALDVPDGKAYKKFYDHWNICDYKFIWSGRPRISWKDGKPELYYPEPLWKINRK